MRVLSLQAQTASDFRAGHAELWRQADGYACEQAPAWHEVWQALGVDTLLAEAVVFPELVRFSKIQDYAETAALRVRYVGQGSRYCDFSIGHFQMKPSFVEKLERRWMQSELRATYEAVFDTADTRSARTERIDRMEQELWQCAYLAMYILVLYEDYPGLATLPQEKQVSYVATAYNRGCPLPGAGKGQMAYIERRLTVRHFHTVVIPGKSTPRYVYPEIALLRYRELLRQK